MIPDPWHKHTDKKQHRKTRHIFAFKNLSPDMTS